MFQERGPGMCPVHGPAHMGSPCPDSSGESPKVEVVADPVEDYGDLDTMFQMEKLDENFDSVRDQMDTLRAKIEKLNRLNAEHKEDPGMDGYVDEAEQELDDAYTLSINGKKLDVRSLCEGRQFHPDKNVDNYNKLVLAINSYIEMSMIGQGVEFIEEM